MADRYPVQRLLFVILSVLLRTVPSHAQATRPSAIAPHLQATLRGSGGDMTVYSADGSLLLTAGGWEWRLWKMPSGTPAFPPISQNADVQVAQFTPDQSGVITATGNAVTRWEARTGKPVGKPLLLKPMVHVALTKDGRLAAGTRKAEQSDYRLGTTVEVFDVQAGNPCPSGPSPARPRTRFPPAPPASRGLRILR